VEIRNPTWAEVCVKASPFALLISFSVFGAMILGYIIGTPLGEVGRIILSAVFTTAGLVAGILGSLQIISRIYGV